MTIVLTATSSTPLAGTYTVISATVTKNGAAVPDGQSVRFSTDFGYFPETCIASGTAGTLACQATISKLIANGHADVAVSSQSGGTAHVRATYDCGSQQTTVQFGTIPETGPFVSSIVPNSGSCAGADVVTINGGRLTGATRVTFGGLPATIRSASDTQIVVLTPTKTLANPQVPEVVDVVVELGTGRVTVTRGFTYFCVDKRITVTSVSPISGTPDGGTAVTVNGTNFGTNIATSRVTFGGVSASITSMTDSSFLVTTPRHTLANPNVPETVDVAVTKDLGLVSAQSAVLPQAYTYRAAGGQCPASASLFISSVLPKVGEPDGGTVVSITGGGFGTTASSVRVTFGGVPAQVVAVSDGLMQVSTPRRTLANPTVPEVVDVVVTADVGGPHCASAGLASGFTYASVPVITSISPRTGPNDTPTRVSIFGSGFQFPMQVFLTSQACGAQKVEAAVISVAANTIVFQTPIAANGNVCLANQLATISVINPVTGVTDSRSTLADAFKYYACPTVSNASPQFGPYAQTTTVTINGQNFAEPVDAQFIPGTGGTGSGTGPVQLTVTSVSSGAIVVQMPPIDPLQVNGGGAVCSNLAGSISISFPSLSCGTPLTVPFSYKVDPPQITNASPTQFDQDGCPAGTPLGCSITQIVTATGAFFADPMTVVLLKDGAPLAYTQVNNPSVSNPATLTFFAPAIRDSDMNQQACTPTGGTGVTGSKYVPTSFGIRVTNKRTGCFSDLPNILIYNPANALCRSTITITGPSTASFPAGTLCSPFGPVAMTASGGVGTLTWAASGLPSGVAINPTTGVISGTPQLAAPGPGTPSSSLAVSVTVTDSSTPIAQTSAPQNYTLVLTDPAATFNVGVPASPVISSAAGGTIPGIIASSVAFGPINWTMAGAPVGATITATGNPATITVPTGVAQGAYSIVVTANDSACGGVSHRNTATISLTVGP